MTPLDDAIELLIGRVRWIIDHLSQEAGGPDPIGQHHQPPMLLMAGVV